MLSEAAQHAVEDEPKDAENCSGDVEVGGVGSGLGGVVDAATNHSNVEYLDESNRNIGQAGRAESHHVHVDEGKDERGGQANVYGIS